MVRCHDATCHQCFFPTHGRWLLLEKNSECDSICGDRVGSSLSFLNTNGIKLRIFVYKVAGLANNAGNSLVIAVFSRGEFIFIVFLPEYMIPVDWYPSDGLSQPNAEASIPWVL